MLAHLGHARDAQEDVIALELVGERALLGVAAGKVREEAVGLERAEELLIGVFGHIDGITQVIAGDGLDRHLGFVESARGDARRVARA